MTQTLPGADIRGFYATLGIELSGRSDPEISVRCFADPDAHRRGDHRPSCRINLINGCWYCHGCGAGGGPFDAATQLDHSNRSAMELLVRFGIAPQRPTGYRRRFPRSSKQRTPLDRPPVPRRALRVTESDVQRWCEAIANQPVLLARLRRERGWQRETIRANELGVQRGRITIPVRDEHFKLVGLLRYQPWARARQNKMHAVTGSRRQLLPHPAREPSHRVLLVEGEPDMIAARSLGLPAIALPGADSWRHDWCSLLAGRQVAVVMDCDRQGRAAARRVADQLAGVAVAHIVDLRPDRRDGYDLTDWLLDGAPDADSLGFADFFERGVCDERCL